MTSTPPSMIEFGNADFLTVKGVISDKCLLVSEAGVIAGYAGQGSSSAGSTVDLGGLNVAPGFIDLQVNGAGGRWVWSAKDVASFKAIDESLLRQGVTRWCPTYISPTTEEISIALRLSREVAASELGVIGWHFEGPWINDGRKGAHPIERIRRLTDVDVRLILKVAELSKVILTVAPELVPADVVEELSRNGVVVFAGHSAATHDKYVEFFEAGGAGVTHIGNASGLLESRQPYAWGALVKYPKKVATVIADGFHLDASVLTILKRSLHPHQLVAISDLVAGPLPGEDHYSLFAERCVRTKDGAARTIDGRLVGSLDGLFAGLRILVQKCGIPLDEAVRMCSLYPAMVLALAPLYGTMQPGSRADMVTFSNYFVLAEVFRDGVLVYRRQD